MQINVVWFKPLIIKEKRHQFQQSPCLYFDEEGYKSKTFQRNNIGQGLRVQLFRKSKRPSNNKDYAWNKIKLPLWSKILLIYININLIII